MRLTGALGLMFSRATVASCGLLAVAAGFGGYSLPANAQTLQPIELVPPPTPESPIDGPGTIYGTSPHGALQPTDVRQSSLWSDYQPDDAHSHAGVRSGCGCSPCQCSGEKKASKQLGKKLLGKLTRGLDIIIFGSGADADGCGCDSACDSGCDSGHAAYDNACDAIGPSHTSGHVHGHAHGHEQPHPVVTPSRRPQVPQPTEWKQPSYGAEPQTTPARPQQRTPQQRTPEDPFKDDPIPATGRATIKPTAFRR